MGCSPKCFMTATIDPATGRRLMISAAGNKRFPTPGTQHGQCPECIREELEEAKLAVFFNNDKDLIARYKKVMTWNNSR